jgi:lactoylglutathione lyase
MRIEHIALWTRDLDRLKRFYVSHFGATAEPHYVNPAKGFESCFLSFADGARLEVMTTSSIPLSERPPGTQGYGLTHLALAVGSESLVDQLAEQLRSEGTPILDGPRRTGDGYYELVLLDPDGNRLEICAERRHDPAPHRSG